MAFNRGNAVRNNAPEADGWKAQGFINLYLRNKKGTRSKLGFIALKDSNANHKSLIEFLEKDPEAGIAKLLENLQMDYRSAEGDPDSGFDLD